ncbi:MAG: UDP-3-O-(3-hydroxymyristoyl)glucosamine N-acyltransferase, partial [Armatimonadetes bacterium]|nr:UDP-3-O-(3-hydroxymyristoyl)glucosamine N-acyltransferase [Armatimonadota bacterium]
MGNDAQTVTLGELAAAVGGRVEGDPATPITAVCSLEDAVPGSLVRVEGKRFLSEALASPAAAFLA